MPYKHCGVSCCVLRCGDVYLREHELPFGLLWSTSVCSEVSRRGRSPSLGVSRRRRWPLLGVRRGRWPSLGVRRGVIVVVRGLGDRAEFAQGFRGVCISECLTEPFDQFLIGREPFDGGQGLRGEPCGGLMLVEVEGI